MIDQPYAAMLARVQGRKPVTLRQNDSINLTTGQVTRSSQSQPANPTTVHSLAVANRNAYKANRTPWYPLVGHREGLRANDLITLDSAFRIMGQLGHLAH